DLNNIKQTSDIDSGIGFVFRGDRFPIQAGFSLFVHVLNNTAYTLESSLHLPRFNIPDLQGSASTIYAEPHQIPHIYFGFMGGASVGQVPVRMMFPQLYVSVRREAREGNMVNRDYVKALYDYGIYLAIKKTLLPKNQQFWPVSFDSKVFRALND
ncbi:unnamed protein product, partial [Rhizoctonia solani]